MKEPACFRWYCFIIWIIFLFSFPTNAVAGSTLFSDEFNSIDLEHWDVSPNIGGNVSISEGSLILSSNPGYFFPYIFLKNVTIPANNFSIAISFKLSGPLSYGNGIVFTDKLLSNGTRNNLSSGDLIFAVWPFNDNATIDISSSLCLLGSVNCVNGSYSHITNAQIDEVTDLVIEEVDNHYRIKVGGHVYETRDSTRKISHVWIGNPQATNTPQNWAKIAVNQFSVENIDQNHKSPVVILPGFGGSWDLGAFLTNTPGGNWKIPPYIKHYDSFIKSIENAGYEEGVDLFIFPYDPRKSTDELVDDFSAFMMANFDENEKVDLVGHSLGGLISRGYAQKYGTEKIDKIITVGTPHLGSVNAYDTWEGAEVYGDFWWGKAALEVAAFHGWKGGGNRIDGVREVRSIKDTLPVFDFLSKDGVMKSWGTHNQVNPFLPTLNLSALLVDAKLTALAGTGIPTRLEIKVQDRSENEALLGLWEDGKPIETDPYVFVDGDNTVTPNSATLKFSNQDSYGEYHDKLMHSQTGLEKIFDILGLDKTKIVIEPIDDDGCFATKVFLAILNSPGTLEICSLAGLCNDNLGLYFPDEKLFMLPGYNGEDLVTRVIENGETGNYKLYLGNIDEEADWIMKEGSLDGQGQADFYGVRNEGEFSVIFDDIAPEIVISSPMNGSYQSENLPPLAYGVTDNWDSSPDVEVGVLTYIEGSHTLTVKATDSAGNTNEASISYTIDNTAPNIQITEPQEGGIYTSTNLPSLNYTLDDSSAKVSILEYSGDAGIHTVQVSATDVAGNAGSDAVTYTVQNPPISKNECKKNNWMLFGLYEFKNQGHCVSFVESNAKAGMRSLYRKL